MADDGLRGTGIRSPVSTRIGLCDVDENELLANVCDIGSNLEIQRVDAEHAPRAKFKCDIFFDKLPDAKDVKVDSLNVDPVLTPAPVVDAEHAPHCKMKNVNTGWLLPAHHSAEGLITASTIVSFSAGNGVFIPFVNMSLKPVSITKDMFLETAEVFNEAEAIFVPNGGRVADTLVASVSADCAEMKSDSGPGNPAGVATNDELGAVIDKVMAKADCDDTMKAKLRVLLHEHRSVLAQSSDSVGSCPLYKPGIESTNPAPVYTPQWPLPHNMRLELGKIIDIARFVDLFFKIVFFTHYLFTSGMSIPL